MTKLHSIALASRVALFLLLLPIALILLKWHWQSDTHYPGLGVFFMITQTVSQPWGIVSTLIILIVLTLRLGGTINQKMRAITACLLVVVMGQLTGLIIKPIVNEPRPFVSELNKSEPYLAGCDPQQCLARLRTSVLERADIADWQRQHWLANLNGAFPSGHSLFASGFAIWILLLLWPHRCYVLCSLTLCWAIAVFWSRLVLGMHWPWDVIASVIISWLLTALVLTVYTPIPASGPPKYHENERSDAKSK